MKTTRAQRSEQRKAAFWQANQKAADKTKDQAASAAVAWNWLRATVKNLPQEVADEMWVRATKVLADLREQAMAAADHRSHHKTDHTN